MVLSFVTGWWEVVVGWKGGYEQYYRYARNRLELNQPESNSSQPEVQRTLTNLPKSNHCKLNRKEELPIEPSQIQR